MFVITVDGDVYLLRSVSDAEGFVEGYDVRDGEYGGELGGLFTVHGEILTPAVSGSDVVDPVRLQRTGRFEPGMLSDRLSALASRNSYEFDPDPTVVANRIFAAYWDLRTIRWPRWLDRRVNGEGPERV